MKDLILALYRFHQIIIIKEKIKKSIKNICNKEIYFIWEFT